LEGWSFIWIYLVRVAEEQAPGRLAIVGVRAS